MWFAVLPTSYAMGQATRSDAERWKLILSVDLQIRSLPQPTQYTLKAGAAFIVVIELVQCYYMCNLQIIQYRTLRNLR